eukprot:GILK01003795.1.p1 GENE.GILK01003795.1~~GILK01003795.1.p1  ORF type:complete len:309 (-),score=41.09 GILK01003795.1:1091-2017(-)
MDCCNDGHDKNAAVEDDDADDHHLVLSDVHIENAALQNQDNSTLSVSYFSFQDGTKLDIIHKMDTSLEDVGFQVWRGALYMCDFIMSQPSIWKDQTVMDLGCGTGIVGILVARFAETVILTDYEDTILDCCAENVERNRSTEQSAGRVLVRQLDFTQSTLQTDPSRSKYAWSHEDLKLLDNIKYFLAADVIYDNELTDALFDRLSDLLKSGNILYLTLEIRINFVMEEMRACSVEYEHFLSKFRNISETPLGVYESYLLAPIASSAIHNGAPEGSTILVGRRLADSFAASCVSYTRVPYLELWQIWRA